MAEIRIHREHALGLKKAREIAWQWAEQVEEKFDMACTVHEGEDEDTVEFTRSGVKGELTVAADHFELVAQLGLVGAAREDVDGRCAFVADVCQWEYSRRLVSFVGRLRKSEP